MGTLYRISRGTHAQSTTADSITIDVPAGRSLKIHQAEASGMASAAVTGAEIGIYRTTANGSGGGTSLPIKNIDPNGVAPPSGFTAKYGYATPPTLEADPVARLSYQPLGGKGRYMALPGGALEFWSLTAYQVSIRGIVGTPNVAMEFEVEL